MGKITLERVKQLEEIGEDVIFDRILSGEAVRTMLAKWRMGWRAWYRWVDSVEGRRARYDQTLMQAGHSYAQRAVETAQNATSENVNVARLQVDTDKWMAGKLNQKYDVRQKEATVTLRIEDLHSQAAALISSEAEKAVMETIEGVAIDVDEAEGSDEADPGENEN